MNVLKRLGLGLALISSPILAHAEELVVAYTTSSVPFSYLSPTGVHVGFNVDMAHAICEKLEAECHFKAVGFPEMLSAVSKGEVDIALPNMLKTPERAKQVAFTIPYWRSNSSFVGPATYSFKGVGMTLKTDSICAISKTRQYSYLKAHNGGSTDRIIETKTTQETLDKMTKGECTLFLMPTMQSLAFLQSNLGRGYNFLGTPVSTDGLGGNVHIIVRPDRSKLLEKVDQALENIIQEGLHGRITRKYFPFSLL